MVASLKHTHDGFALGDPKEGHGHGLLSSLDFSPIDFDLCALPFGQNIRAVGQLGSQLGIVERGSGNKEEDRVGQVVD